MEPVIVRILCNQPCITGSLYTLLIGRLEPSLLFHSVLDIPFLYLPAALMSGVTRVASILGVVAFCYNIFPVEYTIFRPLHLATMFIFSNQLT